MISLLILGGVLAYVGAYLGLLALPAEVCVPSSWSSAANGVIYAKYIEVNGEWRLFPDYHGLPRWLFAPVHEADRSYVRPSKWGGSYPRNEERSFDWLLGENLNRPKGG